MKSTTVTVPGSKPITLRAIYAAAMAKGTSVILNPMISDDATVFLRALKRFGAKADLVGTAKTGRALEISGIEGSFGVLPKTFKLDLGGSGFALRVLLPLAVVSGGKITLDGNDLLRRRPIAPIVNALRRIGSKIDYLGKDGYCPVKVFSRKIRWPGVIELDSKMSSQFVTAWLLASPLAANSLVRVKFSANAPSLPFIDMTRSVMRDFGVESAGGKVNVLLRSGTYAAQDYAIEADAASANYFFAATAATGIPTSVKGLSFETSLQPDAAFIELLASIGCIAAQTPDGVTVVREKKLRSIKADFSQMLDSAPTAAVLALFARGASLIKGVSNLKYKESDRLALVAAGLKKLGAEVTVKKDSIAIKPPAKLRRVKIKTGGDHRIAMAFAVAKLVEPRITVDDPDCVSKSFPDFWKEFAKLEKGAAKI